jgi:lipopolysaccharide transport system ATP-binding protein
LSEIVISVENLSKRYLIGHQVAERQRYVTLRETIGREARNFVRKAGELFRGRPIIQGDRIEEFWALRHLNFEVKQGEVVGIIGHNGAGKSTLLKILSRVTEPTEGRVRLKGRVASLLEVGTGFHPELTGRENIYLNGAILGMSRAEIRRKFDEIVAFAEVDEFLDTPVKRYSSGMSVRLAFAVAAHLEPEILIVDEVLAVGDAEFQKKCLGKMDEVSQLGRTVLLVSHDMRRIASLCSRGILLNGGVIDREGAMPAVIDAYLARRATAAFADLSARHDRTGSGDARFRSIELHKDGAPCRTFTRGDELVQRFDIKVDRPVGRALIGISILRNDGLAVYEHFNVDDACAWNAERGVYAFTVTVDSLNLYPGNYSIDLWIGDRNSYRIDYVRDAIGFDVVPAVSAVNDLPFQRSGGLVYQSSRWTMQNRAVDG